MLTKVSKPPSENMLCMMIAIQNAPFHQYDRMDYTVNAATQ